MILAQELVSWAIFLEEVLKMKIVGVDPQGEFNAYGYYYKFPVLGLLYVAEIWRQAGHKVKIFSEALTGKVYDLRSDRLLPLFAEEIKRAEVLVLTAMTATAKRCYAIARAALKVNSNLKVKIGGPHVSYQLDPLDFPCLIIQGEGEGLAAETLKTDQGILAPGEMIKDLSTLAPPDFSLIPGYPEWLAGKNSRSWRIWERQFPRIVPILGSRGCPFECIFCIVTQMHGGKYRFREPAEIVAEMKQRILAGAAPNFFFYDDNIYGKRSWLIELCDLIIKEVIEGMHLPQFCFRAEARVNIALGQNYDEVLSLLQRAHCKYLLLGFESINPATLREYEKRQTTEEIKLCIRRLREYGLGIHGMFAVGADEDTIETAKETARFASHYKVETVQFSSLFPIPGTRLQKQLEDEGRILSRNWDLYDGSTVVFQPRRMTAAQSQKAFFDGWREFYRHRPKLMAVTLLGQFLWERAHGAAFRQMLSRSV